MRTEAVGRALFVGAAPALALICVSVALHPAFAGTSTRPEIVAFTAAGQAMAKKVILRASDLDTSKGWFGGVATNGNVPFPLPCPTYLRFAPKESDIVVNGAASARWQVPSIFVVQLDTHILRNARMAETVWRRWARPAFLGCLRDGFDPFGTIRSPVSARRVGFPKLGSFSAAFRLVSETPNHVRYVDDTILIASGRARIQIQVATRFEFAAAAHELEVGVATLLARRAMAGAA